ncbi:MAG: prolyl-tRNA synthetase associated domain-containing protein [Candidatus Eremiobacteraeota bacterium]|nr:prolyl-tRNA synthetase associated domain-containing protein [Candidatus Eremiobacteraeota bacterium]
MASGERELYAELDRLGVSVALREHPVVRTIEESKRLRGDLPGGHVKNLLLQNKKGELWLVAALEDTVLDLKELARRLDSGRLSFASAEVLESALGVTPGAVSPLAVLNDAEKRVTVVLERRLLQLELLNFHPLRNDATVTMRTADFLRFLDAVGHSPVEIAAD